MILLLLGFIHPPWVIQKTSSPALFLYLFLDHNKEVGPWKWWLLPKPTFFQPFLFSPTPPHKLCVRLHCHSSCPSSLPFIIAYRACAQCTGPKRSISPRHSLPCGIEPWPQMPLLNSYLYLLFTKTAVSNKQITVIWFLGTACGTHFPPCSLGVFLVYQSFPVKLFMLERRQSQSS